MWCFEIEVLPRPIIKAMHGLYDVFGSNAFETHFFRKELSNQTIHVLVCIALPGAVRVREEMFCIETLGDSLVLCKLFTVVDDQCVHEKIKGLASVKN